MDILDVAADAIMARQDRLVEAARSQGPEAAPTGQCLWCSEELQDPTHRWCDAHCRDDWQAYREHQRKHPVVDEE